MLRRRLGLLAGDNPRDAAEGQGWGARARRAGSRDAARQARPRGGTDAPPRRRQELRRRRLHVEGERPDRRSSPRRPGRREVTGVDVMEATPTSSAREHERRGSAVRFVQRRPARRGDRGGDRAARGRLVQRRPLPRPEPGAHAAAAARAHERTADPPDDDPARVAGRAPGTRLLSGVPNPRLYARWGEHAARSLRLPEPGEDPYAPWWWGISRSALDAMLRAANFEPIEHWGDPFAVHVVWRGRPEIAGFPHLQESGDRPILQMRNRGKAPGGTDSWEYRLGAGRPRSCSSSFG